MTVLGICRRPRASAGWVRGPSTKPSSTRSAYLVPSAEFATPGLGVLVIDDPECLKVKSQKSRDQEVQQVLLSASLRRWWTARAPKLTCVGDKQRMAVSWYPT